MSMLFCFYVNVFLFLCQCFFCILCQCFFVYHPNLCNIQALIIFITYPRFFAFIFCSSDEDVIHVIKQNTGKEKEVLNELDSKINDRKNELHKKLTHCQESENGLVEIHNWLRDADKAMKSLKPMSEDMAVLLQLRDFYEVQAFVSTPGLPPPFPSPFLSSFVPR